MDPKHCQDSQYVNYLYTIVHEKHHLQEDDTLRKVMDLCMPRSAEMMLLTMGMTEEGRSRADTLRSIVSMRARSMLSYCDTASSIKISLQKLAISYSSYFPCLMTFSGMSDTRMDIYMEFIHILQGAKAIGI